MARSVSGPYSAFPGSRTPCRHLAPSELRALSFVLASTIPFCVDMSGLEAILTNPAYHDYLSILKGARNGFVYGVKVRFPHALIMAILFGRGE